MAVVTQLAPGETGTQVCTDSFRDYAEAGATAEKEMLSRLGVELGMPKLRSRLLAIASYIRLGPRYQSPIPVRPP